MQKNKYRRIIYTSYVLFLMLGGVGVSLNAHAGLICDNFCSKANLCCSKDGNRCEACDKALGNITANVQTDASGGMSTTCTIDGINVDKSGVMTNYVPAYNLTINYTDPTGAVDTLYYYQAINGDPIPTR